MSFTSESEDTMIERGYGLEISDGINVFYKLEGLLIDENATVDYEIKPWMSKCVTRGIHVEKEYTKAIAIKRGDQAE